MPRELPIRRGFVFALMDEARPFLKKEQMKPVEALPGHQLFRGEQVAAVVTGIGVEKAAAGTTALQSYVYAENRKLAPHRFFGRSSRLPDFSLLSVGLAGKLDRNPGDLGRLFQINRLQNQASGESHYPDLLVRWEGIREASLVTTPRPVFADAANPELGADLVDMEGTGIMTAARAFVQNHQIHIFKIASDLLQPIANLRTTATPWLEKAAEQLVPALQKWSGETTEAAPVNEEAYAWMQTVADRLRFSFTRRKAWEQICLGVILQGRELPLAYQPPENLSKKQQHEQWHHLQQLLSPEKPLTRS